MQYSSHSLPHILAVEFFFRELLERPNVKLYNFFPLLTIVETAMAALPLLADLILCQIAVKHQIFHTSFHVMFYVICFFSINGDVTKTSSPKKNILRKKYMVDQCLTKVENS